MGGGVELLNEIAFLTFLSQFPVAMFVCVFVQNTLTLKFISITIFTLASINCNKCPFLF